MKEQEIYDIITARRAGKTIQRRWTLEEEWVDYCGEITEELICDCFLRIKPNHTREDYIAASTASGLKVGDRVRVTRRAEKYEGGWGNDWVASMTDQIGKINTIASEDLGSGFGLSSGFGYPYFVLEKVEPREFWVNVEDDADWHYAYESKDKADQEFRADSADRTIHVREVIED